MKKVIKFVPWIGLVFGLVAFILLMACKSVILKDNSGTWYSGIAAIFAGGKMSLLGYEGDFDGKLAWTALLAWIFILSGMIIVLGAAVLALGVLKVNVNPKIMGVLNLVAIGLFITAGVLTFFTRGAFGAANEWSQSTLDSYVLGGGYIAAGILSIVAGAVLAVPTVLDFVAKK